MSAPRTSLEEAFADLRRDLIHEDGPQISTMRNYRFAILPYPPAQEFYVRWRVGVLAGELSAGGWVVRTLSLQQLLLARVRAMGDDVVSRFIEMERRMAQRAPERGLNYLRTKLAEQIRELFVPDVTRDIVPVVSHAVDAKGAQQTGGDEAIRAPAAVARPDVGERLHAPRLRCRRHQFNPSALKAAWRRSP